MSSLKPKAPPVPPTQVKAVGKQDAPGKNGRGLPPNTRQEIAPPPQVGGKKTLPPMPSKVPVKGKPTVAPPRSPVKSYAQTMGGPKKGTPTVKKMK